MRRGSVVVVSCDTPTPPTVTANPPSFRVGGIVEQDSQLDAAVAELREVLFCRVRGIEIRGSVVGRKQDQRVEETQQVAGLPRLQRYKCVARGLSSDKYRLVPNASDLV